MTNCWQITQLSRTFRSDHQCNFVLFVLFMVKHLSIFSVKWMTCFQGKLLHKFHLCQRLCHFGLFLDGFFERLARVLHSVCVLGHRLSNWRMPLCGLYRIIFGCKKLTEWIIISDKGAQAVKYWGGQIGKKSLICLDGKSINLFGEILFSSLPPSNSLVSVSDPWRAFWADTAPFKGPRLTLCVSSGTTGILQRHR